MESCIWAIRWQYKWFFCKSFRSWNYFTHIYKTFIPSTAVIKSLFVRDYLWKLPEGLLPDSLSVAKCKLHRFVSVNSKYGFRVCVHLRYSLSLSLSLCIYIYIHTHTHAHTHTHTEHTNWHDVSKRNEAT